MVEFMTESPRILAGWLALLFSLGGAGCGASQASSAPTVTIDTSSLDVPEMFRTYGKDRSDVFTAPAASFDELEQTRKETRGADRVKALRDLAVAYLWAAEDASDPKEKRTFYRKAERSAENAIAGNGDPEDAAEAEFVLVWSAWRRATPRADRNAEIFAKRRSEAGELVLLSYLIRGEVALEGRRFSEARAHYRYLLGLLDHPLYAFALYRTADARRAANENDEASQIYRDVRELGCRLDASPETLLVAAFAAARTEADVRRDAAGKIRPSTCKLPEDEAASQSGAGASGNDIESGSTDGEPSRRDSVP